MNSPTKKDITHSMKQYLKLRKAKKSKRKSLPITKVPEVKMSLYSLTSRIHKISNWMTFNKFGLANGIICGQAHIYTNTAYIYIDNTIKSTWERDYSAAKAIESVTVHELIHLLNPNMKEKHVRNAEEAAVPTHNTNIIIKGEK